MFKEMKSRRLALFVAIALGGGGFLSSAQNVSAADVVIDDAHPTVAADHKVGTGAAGGVVKDPSGTADVTGNTLTLTKRGFGGRLFGGYTAGSGNVTGNKVFIHNETAHVVQEKVYGGHANGSGNATSNTVTLTGGTFSDNIYGGSSVGGNATRNTVNLGDGTKAFAGTIHGTIYGGDGPGTGNHVTGNTLNVNADVTVGNIKNFETIHFNYNKNINTGNAILTLGGGSGATTVDWNGIHLNGTPERSKMTLMQNTNGININNYTPNKVIALDDKFESYITGEMPHSPTKYSSIVYKRNQFAGVEKTVDTSDGIPGTSEVDVYGGESVLGNTTTGNHVTITRMTGHGKVYGGYTEGDGTTADVAKRYDSKGNKVTITGGAASELYGGYTSSTVGAATGNTVTVKRGAVRRLIYGGFAEHGDATGNTVNLGDAETGAVGDVSASKIFGGRSRDNTKDQTTGNTLNVNARTTAYNIENFAKINFNFKHVTGNTSLLTLTDAGRTKINDLGMLDVQNVPRGEGSLLENTHGIVVSTYNGAVSKTYEKTETIIDKSGTTKINYKGYQFKGARDSRTVGNATWGGRSVIGNTTTDNIVTLTGNYAGQNVYGGWTSGTGSTATGTDAKNHSIGNKITFDNADGAVENMVGGVTASEGGNATDNHAVLKNGTVYQSLTGGSVGSNGGNTMRNIVDIDGGTVHQSVYGGDVGSSGKAEKNIVTLTSGTVNGAIFGGVTTSGEAVDNKVYIKGGSATNQDVYGGFSTNGDAPSNTVTVTGGSVRNVVGGKALGDASGNTVTVGNVTVNSITGGDGATTKNNTVNIDGTMVTNKIVGGTKADVTGNTLNVKGVNTAKNIEGFQKMHFDTTGATGTMLTLNDGTNKTKVDWNKLTAGGNGQNITLLKNNNGIDFGSTYSGGAVKSGLSADKKSETNVSVTADKKEIKYTGYQFTGVTGLGSAVGGNLYGGVSKAGNATHDNKITVNGNYDEVYGGHTTGTSNMGVEQKNSHDNTVTITGGTLGKVYGGWTAASDGTTNDNTVNLGDGTHPLATGTTVAEIHGGNKTATGNTLNVNTSATVGTIGNFSKVTFKDKDAKLKLTAADAAFDLAAVKADFAATAMATTLVESDHALTLANDKTFRSDLSAGGTRETNIEASTDKKKIVRYGYTLKNATTATTVGSDTWGGRSVAGHDVENNAFTLNEDTHTNVYGGWTTGAASHNTVTLGNITVAGNVTGGAGTTTNDNTVNLNGTKVTGTITGGTAANGTGNTLNVKGKDNKAGAIANIQKMNFDATGLAKNDTMLEVTGTAQTDVNWADLSATGTAVKPLTLLKNANGINLTGYTGAVKSETTETTETNIDVVKDSSNKITEITYEGYQFKGVTTATADGGNLYGGISKAGNSTRENTITVDSGSHTNVYGGWTSGTGSKAAADQRGDSTKNSVTVKGAATVSGTVYGGYTDVTGGKATGNTVTVEKTINADIIGGKAAAEASGNTVNVTNAAVKSITGGFGTVTNDNRINLRDAKVTGMVTGGTAANGTGNTLNVSYGTKTTEIGDYKGIRNLHFDMEKAPMDGTAHTMLRLTNVGGAKSLSHTHIDLHRDGAAPKLQQGDKITLMENAGGDINVGENLTAKGTDGVTRNYEFALATVGKTLIATVTKAGLGEQAKSFAETRAGASAFLNDGGDYLAGSGMEAAKKEAHAAAQAGSGAYGLWAGMGGGALRHETGSYVDMKGWNLGLGWARENAVQAGTLTFGPFVEYGRGSYDSYLDDGTHGSGKTSFFGAGMMAKLETGSHWIDGSLRVGRTKSDYTGLDTGYDTTSTYYAMHVGVGKDFHVREGDTVSAYVRYSYAHTAGTSAHLSSGETFDFDAVNSHRLRLGTRYTHGMTALSQFYAGLAWEYEFDGDARATSQGDSAPSPSLKGSSALLELGYRFAPKADSRMSYDLNLTGWQGKRQGITGGLSVKWAF